MLKNGFASHNKIKDTEGLLRFGTSFQLSHIFFESVRIGLFDEIGDKTVPASVLAKRLNLSGNALSRFLRVLHEIGLVEKQGNIYRNTALSKKYLRKGEKAYLGDFFTHLESLQAPWLHLQTSLKTNKMIVPDKGRLSAYSEQLKKFLLAMHAVGQIKSKYIKRNFSIHRYRNMLDVGGGMGTYAVSFAKESRNLRATVFDLKTVIPHAKLYIKGAGMQNRIKVMTGECLHDTFPQGPYDLVFISNLLHVYDTLDCKKIINKAAGVLAEKGTLLIHDYILGCGDTFAVSLFDMTMLVGTPQGRCHERRDIQGWMRSAGIPKIRTAEVFAGTSMVWGVKIVNRDS